MAMTFIIGQMMISLYLLWRLYVWVDHAIYLEKKVEIQQREIERLKRENDI